MSFICKRVSDLSADTTNIENFVKNSFGGIYFTKSIIYSEDIEGLYFVELGYKSCDSSILAFIQLTKIPANYHNLAFSVNLNYNISMSKLLDSFKKANSIRLKEKLLAEFIN